MNDLTLEPMLFLLRVFGSQGREHAFAAPAVSEGSQNGTGRAPTCFGRFK